MSYETSATLQGSIILDGQNIADVSQSLVDGVTMAGAAEQSLQNIAFVGDILNQKAGLIQNMSNSSFLAIAKQVSVSALRLHCFKPCSMGIPALHIHMIFLGLHGAPHTNAVHVT